MLQPADRAFPQALGLIFLAVLLVSAIGPMDPLIWALENLLVLILAGLLGFYRRAARLLARILVHAVRLPLRP